MTDMKKISCNVVRPLTLLLFALLVTSGCGTTSGFAKYYRENPGAGGRLQYAGEPRILVGKNPESDRISMIEDGYLLKGSSAFNGPNADPDQAKEQAKIIGAEVVILYSKFDKTVSGVKTSSFGSSYATGGQNSVVGFSGATGYTVPFSIDRYDHLAVYWVRAPRSILGAVGRELNADERERLRRGRGVSVISVRNGSSAKSAGISQGDVIVDIDGNEIAGGRDFEQLVRERAGKEVMVSLLRDGEKKVIRIKLNEAAP